MLSDAECSVFYNRVRRDVEEGFYVKEDILLLLKEMAEKVKGGGDVLKGSWVIQEKQVIIPVKQRSLVCVECTHRFEDPCPPCKWKAKNNGGE